MSFAAQFCRCGCHDGTAAHVGPCRCEVPPELVDRFQALLGCEWGRTVWTPDDPEPCNEQAVQMVQFHDPHGVAPEAENRVVKLCAWHRTRVAEELTDPHDA